MARITSGCGYVAGRLWFGEPGPHLESGRSAVGAVPAGVRRAEPVAERRGLAAGGSVSASLSTRQTWTALRHDGPNHLGLLLIRFRSALHRWFEAVGAVGDLLVQAFAAALGLLPPPRPPFLRPCFCPCFCPSALPPPFLPPCCCSLCPPARPTGHHRSSSLLTVPSLLISPHCTIAPHLSSLYHRYSLYHPAAPWPCSCPRCCCLALLTVPSLLISLRTVPSPLISLPTVP